MTLSAASHIFQSVSFDLQAKCSKCLGCCSTNGVLLPRAVAFGDTLPTIDFCKTYKPHIQRIQRTKRDLLSSSGYMLNYDILYIYILKLYNMIIYVYIRAICCLCLLHPTKKYGVAFESSSAPQKERSSEPPRRENHSSVHQPVPYHPCMVYLPTFG